MKTYIRSLFSTRGIFYIAVVASAITSACTPEGVINKTKYNGQKITNTCDSFKEEVDAIVNANSNPSKLIVAEYDNSDFDYYYLEPGQFEIKDGNLNFRLAQDLEYAKYLTKGVAIHANVAYESQEHLSGMESPNEGSLGYLIVDEAYFNEHKEPFFYYSVPLNEEPIEGKQLKVEFSVVKYKKGEIKKVFCNSMEMPIGTVEPACCTSKPWEDANLQSVIELPEIDIDEEAYRYRGFTGTLDLIFPMSSTKFDQDILAQAMENYIRKYDSLGYDITSINMEGYASLGGTEKLNQTLSEKRVKVVYDALTKAIKDTNITINYAGKGEDWERLILLTKTSVLTPEQQQAVLAIAEADMPVDQKEAELRKLKFWQKLVDEVIVNTRHVFITFNFDYQPDKMFVEYYPSKMPVMSDELMVVANKVMTVDQWEKEMRESESKKNLKVLDVLIGNNKKANLFAMRSTYHFGLDNYMKAVEDIDMALDMDQNNRQYAIASLAYKTKFSDAYTMDERMDMLEQYDEYIQKYPDSKALFFNRAVMMDKVGFITGALAEYDELLEGAEPTAANLNNRGVAKLKTNMITSAEEDFKAAANMDGDLAQAWFNLAVVYAWRGLTNQAIENLDKAIALDENYRSMIWENTAFRIMRESSKFDKYR